MNPRDKRRGDRRALGSGGRPGGAVWYVLGFLMLMALAQAWFLAPGGRAISYSDFKQAVRSGQVAEVVVGEQTISGTYRRETNGSRNFNVNRIEDPKLLEELDAAQVKYTGEFVSRWLPEVLGWVIPILLLFALFVATLMRHGWHAVRACRQTDLAMVAAAILCFEIATCLQSWSYSPLHYPPSRVLFWFWAGVLLRLPELHTALAAPRLAGGRVPVGSVRRMLRPALSPSAHGTAIAAQPSAHARQRHG